MAKFQVMEIGWHLAKLFGIYRFSASKYSCEKRSLLFALFFCVYYALIKEILASLKLLNFDCKQQKKVLIPKERSDITVTKLFLRKKTFSFYLHPSNNVQPLLGV